MEKSLDQLPDKVIQQGMSLEQRQHYLFVNQKNYIDSVEVALLLGLYHKDGTLMKQRASGIMKRMGQIKIGNRALVTRQRLDKFVEAACERNYETADPEGQLLWGENH